MRNDDLLPAPSELSYLDASRVTSPAGVLSELKVLSADGQPLGSIEGVVIEATARRVRYLAVRLAGWFRDLRFFVKADHLAQIEVGRKTLRLRGDLENEAVHGLDAAALREFSDDDLLAALFSPRTA
jgi:hypothetical protein